MRHLKVNFAKTVQALILSVLVISLFSSCKKDDEPQKSDAKTMTNVKIIAGENQFDGIVQSNGTTFHFSVPLGFDQNQLTSAIATFTIPSTATANPPSGSTANFMTDVNYTVTAEDGSQAVYTIHKVDASSSEADFLTFSVDVDNVNVAIDKANAKITLTVNLTTWNLLSEATPTFTLSVGATVSPASSVKQNFKNPVQYVVTANDGTSKTWTVTCNVTDWPTAGIRPESAKILFAKQLRGDLGITVDHVTGGIALYEDVVIINTRNENSICIDGKTGEKVHEFDLGPIKGGLTNFYTTNDAGGNVLVCNLAPNDGTFKVWRLTSITGDSELFIDWAGSGDLAVGRKMSVRGNISTNAIITAPILGEAAEPQFARWTVSGGNLASQTPEIITISGHSGVWRNNADVIYTTTSTTSDYFVGAYSPNFLAWVNGATNQVRSSMSRTIDDDGNWITNAVDYIEFNNAKYVTANWINSFNWGSCDIVWLLDVTSEAKFTGNLSFSPATCPAVAWQSERHIYGAWALSVQNTNGTGDVAMKVSDDGKYLYLYFMFTNGSIVGVQFDCEGVGG